ncbi:MAG: mannose-6-phosphate isomerase [Phycisphaerae bacterium]|jgi:mannose-6-phosphate isomerase
MDVYPLIFEPILKPKIWGGRNLARVLNKQLPPDDATGESWEAADLEDDQSVVKSGPARGRTLGQLVAEWGTHLVGRAPLFEGRFPLLIKFLDATQTLSVQVHPDEAMAHRLGGRVRVKNEAWYVVNAEPSGFIYRGLRSGVDAPALVDAIQRKQVETVLERIPARKGHCFYLPSGTLHALGAGVLVAEVQTPSDVTYRVYDWDRVDPSTGKPRDLHLEQALQCISFDTSPIAGERTEHVASVWASVTSLVRCPSFTIERVRMSEGVDQQIPHQELVVWMVLEGRGTITCAGEAAPVDFAAGDTVVIPAAIRDGRVQTHEDCMWLEVTIPVESSLAEFERPDRQSLSQTPDPNERTVPLNVPNRPPNGATGTQAE